MIEYIYGGVAIEHGAAKGETRLERREEIVRCRDCKWFCEERRCTSVGWNDVFTCYSDQWSTSSLMPSHKVEPDGFCAWGVKRKEGGE